MSLGKGSTSTHKLLDRLVTVLDPTNNNVFLWPFLESTGIDIMSYANVQKPLLSGEAAAYVALDDAATGWAPYRHAGGVHSYFFSGADDQHLEGADAATLSFAAGTDAPFSVGCFFRDEGGTGTLIAKYDAVGLEREWKLSLVAGPDLSLLLYDESATAEEGAQTTAALSTRTWHHGAATYSGVGGDGAGAAGDGVVIYVDGAAVADTDVDDATYVDMEDLGAPLMLGANDDNAGPANLFTGRMALPFLVNAALSAAEVAAIYGISKTLLGL